MLLRHQLEIDTLKTRQAMEAKLDHKEILRKRYLRIRNKVNL